MRMAGELKILGRDAVIYGSGDVLLKIIGLITIPIFTRIFTPTDYGIIETLTAFCAFLAPILLLGMDYALQVYYFDKSAGGTEKVFATSFFAVLCWSLLVTTILLFFVSQISTALFKLADFSLFLSIVLFSLFIGNLIQLFKYNLRYKFQPWRYNFISIINSLLSVAGALLLVIVFKMQLTGFYLSAAVVSVFCVVIAWFWSRQDLKIYFSVELFKKLARYGIPFVPVGLVYLASTLTDRFLLNKFADLEAVGLYSISFKISNVLSLLLTWFGLAWTPYAFRTFYENKDYPLIFRRILNYVLIVFSFCAIGLTVFSREVIQVLTPPQYHGAYIAVGPLCLSVAAVAANQVTSFSLAAAKIVKFALPFSALTAIMNIGMNIALIPVLGILGAAISAAAAQIFLTAVWYVLTHKVVKLWKFDTRKVLIITFCAILYIAGSYFITFPHITIWDLILNIILKIVYSLSFPLVLFLLNVFEPSEIMFLKSLASREFVQHKLMNNLKSLLKTGKKDE